MPMSKAMRGYFFSPNDLPLNEFIDKVLKRFTRLIIRYHLLVLLIGAVSSYFAYQQARTLKLDTNITSLMPKGVASVDNLNRVLKKTGSFSSLMVVVETPNQSAAEKFLKALRAQLLTMPWVSSASYFEDLSVFSKYKLLYVDMDDLKEIQRRIKREKKYRESHLSLNMKDTKITAHVRGDENTPPPPKLNFDDIWEKYKSGGTKEIKSGDNKTFQSKDGRIHVMVILPNEPATNIGNARQMVADVQTRIDALNPKNYSPDMKVMTGGRIKNRVLEFDAVITDLTGSAFWSVAGILLLLIIYFRRIMAIAYIGLPLLASIICTFGLTAMVLGRLNLISVFLIIILFGLGVDYGIHNLSRYDESRSKGLSIFDSLFEVLRHTGQASLLAAATTVAGFYSLLMTNFRAFFEFGFIAGTGVLLAFLSMYIYFPALIVFAEKIKLFRPRSSRPSSKESFSDKVFPHAQKILFGSLLLILTGIPLVSQVGFEEDFSNLQARLPEKDAIEAKIREVFPLKTDRAVVFVQNLDDMKKLVNTLNKRKTEDKDSPTIDRVVSIYDYVQSQSEQDAKLKIIRDIRKDVDEAKPYVSAKDRADIASIHDSLDIGELSPEDLPPTLRRLFSGLPNAGGYLVYIYNSVSMSQAVNARAFADDIREIPVGNTVYYPAAEALIFVDMINLMKRDASKAVFGAAIATFLVLFFGTRNFFTATILLIPTAIGFWLLFSIMGLFDIKLSIINMVALPSILGLGVDNGTHIFIRYREQGPGSLLYVLRTTGFAVTVSTLTTGIGFAGLLSAQNQGLHSLGLVAVLGVGTCLIASITVFPAFLQWLEARKRLSRLLLKPMSILSASRQG